MASDRSLKNKKILITCGPTGVPIDTMRIISNLSSGTLGQTMARDFARAGAKVTLLEGPVTKPMASTAIRILKFVFFDDFIRLIKKELKKKYDVCIHAAAVSDYKLKNPRDTKMSSKHKTLFLELVPTKKIINDIKKLDKNLFLVGFKLESNMTKTTAAAKSKPLFQKARCDLVVANTAHGSRYAAYVLDKRKKILAHKKTRKQLSGALVNIIKEKL